MNLAVGGGVVIAGDVGVAHAGDRRHLPVRDGEPLGEEFTRIDAAVGIVIDKALDGDRASVGETRHLQDYRRGGDAAGGGGCEGGVDRRARCAGDHRQQRETATEVESAESSAPACGAVGDRREWVRGDTWGFHRMVDMG